MARREINPEQLVRIDGKNCFLEVMDQSFPINKVRINFVQYDGNTHKQTCRIDIYLGLDDFDYLYQGTMHNGNGYLLGEVFNNQYGSIIYRGGKKQADGSIIAKELKLQPGQKKPLILVAEEGPGNENRMGGFSIIRGNGSNIKRVMIPLEFKDIVHICNTTNNALIAYRAFSEMKRVMGFEMDKIKDIAAMIAGQVGCDQNVVANIMNRELPRPWQVNNNNNGGNNYNNSNSYNNAGGQQQYSQNQNQNQYQQNQYQNNSYPGGSDYYNDGGPYGNY